MSEAFGERLRRLRRESEPQGAASSPPAARPELPGWFRERLERHEPAAAPAVAASMSAGEPRDLVGFVGPRGPGVARWTRWDLEHLHGRVSLGSALQSRSADLALVAADARLDGLRLGEALFLDIETTGLAGGAGTKAFLVGLGSFGPQGFELWQGFLRGPEDEAALLEECARRVGEAGALVSFFGKSFDRHRLEDKMRVHGIEAPFERCLHLDLYHPCRRLYGAELADGRLATMERAIAGVVRPHDLPGAFAPAAWYDFLAGRAHRLEEVFEHNRDDILSLVAIASELAALASGAAAGTVHPARAVALARSAERIRRWEECRSWAAVARSGAEELATLEEALALEARACEELAACEGFEELLRLARACEATELAARIERRRQRTLRRWRARAGERAPSGSGSAPDAAPAT